MQQPFDYTSNVEKLKNIVIPAPSILIVTHDYPDPDCMASAFGLSVLLNFWGVELTAITFGGFIGRAENRSMIRYVNINTVPFALIDIKDFNKIILVDSFPGNANVSLPKDAPISAVFDHHLKTIDTLVPFFVDIRPHIGATSTIIFNYLLAAKAPISPSLATVLFYGIKSDTRSLSRDCSSEDLESYLKLFNMMDHALLSKIENPDRDGDYFRVLHRAVQSARAYGILGFTHLGRVSAPDSIAEVADLFLSLEKIECMITTGIFKKKLYFSIRTKNIEGAGNNAESIADHFGGSGGGHATIGAGSIPILAHSNRNLLLDFLNMTKQMYKMEDAVEEKIV